MYKKSYTLILIITILLITCPNIWSEEFFTNSERDEVIVYLIQSDEYIILDQMALRDAVNRIWIGGQELRIQIIELTTLCMAVFSAMGYKSITEKCQNILDSLGYSGLKS